MVVKQLSSIIYEYEHLEFSWEELDCCIFTVSVIENFTGRTLPLWREVTNYKNYRGAMKALKKLGCKDLLDLPSVILDRPKKDIDTVKLGEPVYYINENGIGILGVCNGVRAYFLQQGGGLTARPIKDCLYCWSID